MGTWTRLVACGAAIAALAGCATTTNSTVTVSGTSLVIYASNPPGAPGSHDILDAEQLALRQGGSSAGRFTIRFVPLSSQKPSDNARTAIQDTTAIGYLGELSPGDSDGTLGITNDQDLLQVSPTDTAIAATQSTPAVPGAPNNYYEQLKTYGRTFARVVPSGVAEARAQVAEMRSLKVNKLYVADDGSDYGKAIAYAVSHDATADGISVVPGAPTAAGVASAGADALFYGGAPASQSSAQRLIEAVAGQSPKVKVFVPSALGTPSLASSLGSVSVDLYLSEPGFLTKDLSQSARQQFLAPFEADYGHVPGPEAIFGYEAMSALLAVLREAGSQASNRSRVVHDFFAIKDRTSVLGTYSIDSQGDTSISPFVFSRLAKGTFVPYKFVQASP
jgi:branched-chain amino acid transport system substrate-binding protein